jgi:glycosyltransferase involved in cell wall biosynthesis
VSCDALKIAYDARSLFAGGTGDVTYFRSLLTALAAQESASSFVLYGRESDSERDALATRYPNVSTQEVPFPLGWLWNQGALVPRLRRDGMQLLHSQYLLPPRASCPTVVTIHDITFRMFPQWFPPRACRIMNILIPLAARTATHIITGSQCSKDDIIKYFGVREDKITVTPYAAGPQFRPILRVEAQTYIAARYPALRAPYLVGIGLRGARKNVGVVLRAIRMLCDQNRWPARTILALAGSEEHFPAEDVTPVREVVQFLGFVPNEDLSALYAAAQASVYPSLYEGFGLPLLEAMACGCPVLSSDAASLPEVAGDAGILLPPNNIEAWANALEKILKSEAERSLWGERGLERAAHFSWQRTARDTMEVYRRCL